MSEPQPTLNKKGVASLLGCTLATVKTLVDRDQLIGYAMNEAGDGWERHPGGRGAIDLFFDLEDVLRVRKERPKKKPTISREGDVQELPPTPVIPTLSSDQAAARLALTRNMLWRRVRQAEMLAYVINRAGTGWTYYGEPDAAPGATLFFAPEDVARAESNQKPGVGRPPQGLIPRKAITVNCPIDLLEQIDQKTKSRNAWIIKAIQEKLRQS